MTIPRLKPAAIVGLLAVAALPLLVRLLFPNSEKYYLHLLEPACYLVNAAGK